MLKIQNGIESKIYRQINEKTQIVLPRNKKAIKKMTKKANIDSLCMRSRVYIQYKMKQFKTNQ